MRWNRCCEVLVRTTEIICALLLISIAALTVAQVVMRYVFNNPFVWSEELSIAAFIYMTFLGISVAYAKDRHLWVDAFVAVLPRTAAIIVNSLILALSAGFFILVSILMVKVMVVTWNMGITTAALEIPRAFIYLSLPLGCVLFLIQVLEKFRKLGRTQ
jgi:TRAP-type C4-dicarboxylate transport system permease small subunit